ncbi:CBS domain-containing membrane protein [Methylophilus rhizosphaerae]|uniref:CBS domain-containing membrane protein n=1 Tax=Methylophilus rhizosphaerae TaxID=492660 RepID=A0A1G9DWH0_9PROT|nr:HPP family protein [Methylophilus rhizosphaerae]SDK68207.1 CBS domain-containing membrane protein [Methylophilus rhizosphaerae]
MSFLKAYWPRPATGSMRDHARAAIGAGLGILSTGLIAHAVLPGDWQTAVFLIAPIGASAVILFCLPSSPLAQPWSMLGGNLIAATSGVFFTQLLPHHLAYAAAFAILAAISLMFALRCLHPPSGAVALTAVLGGDAVHSMGYTFVGWPVLANSLLLILSAWLYHTLTGYRYPAPHTDSKPTSPAHMHYQFGFKEEDLQAALGEFHEVLDISPENLQMLLQQTELIAYHRKLEEIECRHIMRPVEATLHFGDSLEHAWETLSRQPEPAIPVVNKSNLVIGLLSVADFMRHAKPEKFHQVAPAIKRLIRWSPTTTSNKPEVVGQIMTTPVITILEDMHLIHTIPLITTHHLQLVPVIDHHNKLVGILTQTDVIRALYR